MGHARSRADARVLPRRERVCPGRVYGADKVCLGSRSDQIRHGAVSVERLSHRVSSEITERVVHHAEGDIS